MRLLFVLLAFLSGAVALSHELLWTRRLVDLLGATEAITGRVLGLFFLGLALGGWLATRWSQADGSPVIRLALAELAIAILSIPALLMSVWVDSLLSTLGTDLLVSWQGVTIRILLAVVVVLPPAVAMGTTMPMFIQVITALGGTVRAGGIWIYSLNMLGGVFGLWFVSTHLLESAGVQGAMLVAGAGNILIAAVVGALAFSKLRDPKNAVGTLPAEDQKQDSDWVTKRRLFALAFASGAIVLAAEVLILRLLALVAPSSIQTTSALLANVILFLAFGSIAVAIMNRFSLSSQTQLVIGVIGASVFCAACPLILYRMTNSLVSIRYLVALEDGTISSVSQYWFLLFTIVASSSGAAMFFFGLVFPSILSMHAKLDPGGRSVGSLLAVNGIGGLLGAELANWLMIAQVGIYGGFAFVAVVIATIGIAVIFANQKTWLGVGVCFGLCCVGLACFQQYPELRYLSPNTKNKFRISNTCFGRDGVLMVIDDGAGSRSLLSNNQYVLGSSGHAENERRQLLLPWLLHPECEEVCCLGFATGISANGLSDLQSSPNVTAIELSKTVVDIAQEFFRDQNQAFFDRSGNKVLVEDARTYIASANNDFDLIVADLFRPHGAGESRLFSLEHFQNTKRALRSGGLFCQWLPAHQLNIVQFESIANTFQQIFPNTLVICGSNLSRTPSIGLCGWQNDARWEKDDLLKKIDKVRKQKGISDRLTLNAQLLILGVLPQDWKPAATINTLNNAYLEINAGKFWITKDLRAKRPPDSLENGFLRGNNWKTFLQRLFDETEPVLDPIRRTELLQILK